MSTLNLEKYPQAAFIPWTWTVKSDLSGATCPSRTSVLVTFASINIAVALLNLIFGNRMFIKIMTCGSLGRDGSTLWKISFVLPLGIQIAANAFIAFIYKGTPGYATGFSIVDLMLFFTTRPRLGWILLSFMLPVGAKNHIAGYYTAAAKGALMAELALLLIGSYYMGYTAHFAASHGYYLIGHLQGPYGQSAHVMYAGALLYLISLVIALLCIVCLITIDYEDLGITSYVLVFLVIITSYTGSWMFWAGYVFLAGDL